MDTPCTHGTNSPKLCTLCTVQCTLYSLAGLTIGMFYNGALRSIAKFVLFTRLLHTFYNIRICLPIFSFGLEKPLGLIFKSCYFVSPMSPVFTVSRLRLSVCFTLKGTLKGTNSLYYSMWSRNYLRIFLRSLKLLDR